MTSNGELFPSQSTVRAYQSDLERIGERPFLRSRSADALWLRDAIWLEREASFMDRRLVSSDGTLAKIHARFRASRVQASILDGASGLEQGVAEVLQRSEKMEESGGLTLAMSFISAARAIWVDRAPYGAALSLVQMGRIARTLGHHGAASTFYANAARDANALNFDVVRSRALLGQGAIYHERGHLAGAAQKYRAAALASTREPSVRSMAWLGLSSIAHRQGDVAASLKLGYQALVDAPESTERRAEVLVNIGCAALAADRPEVALRAARWVLRHRVHQRSRCLAIGVATLAAARLGRTNLVRAYVALARRETSSASLPYPVALMWAVVARAEKEAGLAVASRAAADRAKRMATRHGFAGIDAEVDHLRTTSAIAPVVSGELIERLELTLSAL